MTALVTGSSRGIGRGIALALAHAGAKVVVNYRSRADQAEVVARDLEAMGRLGDVIQADVTSPEEVSAMVERATKSCGSIDVLVNNAGITWVPELSEARIDEIDAAIATNVRGVLLCTRAVLPAMRQQSYGQIISIASGAVFHGGLQPAEVAVYAATKAAVVGFTRAMARPAARDGIRVNCVAPGPIDTEAFAEGHAVAPSDETLLGWKGTPADIGAAVTYLASPSAGFIFGQTLCVNGGNYFH